MAKTREGSEKKVSQRAMVQSALEICGWDAKPQDMQGHIKQTYGVELAPNIISNYKSQIKRATRSPGANGTRGRRDKQLQIEDVETVRNLVDRLGADRLKKIIDVVA